MEEVEEEEEGEYCDTSLALAIGGRQFFPANSDGLLRSRNSNSTTLQFRALFPHSTHRLREEEEEEESVSRSKNNIPREEEEEEETSNCISDANGSGSRKKLKLTKEQVSLLENSFRDHSTLHMSQKKHLAERLNIRPRQVEVWFQNRRARTKLKKIEVDCECLKRWCERLSDENRRLKEELQELKSEARSPLQVQQLLEAATLTVCPYCERTTAAAAVAGRSASQLAGPPVNSPVLGGGRRSK